MVYQFYKYFTLEDVTIYDVITIKLEFVKYKIVFMFCIISIIILLFFLLFFFFLFYMD